MNTVKVLPAREWDVRFVADHLREEDRAEVEAATGKNPVAVMLLSHRVSAESHAVFAGDSYEPIAIFGVLKAPKSHKGIVWMLCTPEVTKHSKGVLQTAQAWVEDLSSRYNGLQCLAWSGNDLHVRWCKILGFVALSTRELNGQVFVHLERKNV